MTAKTSETNPAASMGEARPDAAVDRDEEARVIKNLEQLLLRDLAASSFQLRTRAATVSAPAGPSHRCTTPRGASAHLGIIGEDKVLGQADLGAVEAHVEDLILAPAAARGVSSAAEQPRRSTPQRSSPKAKFRSGGWCARGSRGEWPSGPRRV